MSKDKVRVAGVVHDSITDGPGLRFVIFTQGCCHRCKGCHNPHTWDFDAGEEETSESLLAEIDRNPLIKGITLSGGEPFLQSKALIPFAKEVKARGFDIAAYSGFLFSDLCADEEKRELLELCDVLVDGKFDVSKQSLECKFKGSENQRVIDVKKSLKSGKVVLVKNGGWV